MKDLLKNDHYKSHKLEANNTTEYVPETAYAFKI